MRNIRTFAIALAAVMVATLGVVLGPPAPATAAVDVYTTPGEHHVNGRRWNTECTQYSTTVERCRTEIWATTTTWNGRAFVNTNGWAFNNLTYKPSPRANWLGNPLATPGEHMIDGRRWKTECDTAWTGLGGCRSLIWATTPEHHGSGYRMTNKWVFNNMVNFTDSGPGNAEAPAGASVTISGPSQVDVLEVPQLTGTVTPAVAGTVVNPQVMANGVWTGLPPVRTDAQGRFSAPYEFNVGRPGAVTVRARAATADGAVWLSADTITVTRTAQSNTAITATTPAEINHTYRVGCPVGASDLSTIRTNYYGLDGLVHRGEIIVRKDLAADVAKVFEQSLAKRFPIGQMVNPNHWKGDDKAMMAANNSSAFNCRAVVGNPSARSPHSYGIAVDINPWQNPYRDPSGKWWPSTAHVQRTPVVPGQLTSSSAPVTTFKDLGWSWFSGWDWHHFEYRGARKTTTATAASETSPLSVGPAPSATTAGTLTADDLARPTGWDGVVADGSEEAGWTGNGTFAHEVDPQRKSMDLFALGCQPQPDLEAPTAVLEGTLGSGERPGVTLALEFSSDAAAATWLAKWQDANRDCGDVTVTTDEAGAWEAGRDMPDGYWNETAALEGDVVNITMLRN